ncbi:MAG: TMEM175 family protein [Leptolyngbyaceae cyanobacterium bins.302]|nr:TMEM175 family protein [Leptolyngbyaceae cyanobacterium bins.302]
MQPDHSNSQTAIHHLARLSDCVFALAMAITFMGFELPETVQLLSNLEVNQFLIGQLKSLGIYIITFILVAFYWINHTQQFSYFKRTNETHLFIYTLYLMCLLVIPFSNDLVFRLSSNPFAKIWFNTNILLIGFLSFTSWSYATHQHLLVDEALDRQIIRSMQVKALIEPVCALMSIPVALISPDLSDLVWLLIPVVSLIMNKALKQTSESNMMPVSNQLVK